MPYHFAHAWYLGSLNICKMDGWMDGWVNRLSVIEPAQEPRGEPGIRTACWKPEEEREFFQK